MLVVACRAGPDEGDPHLLGGKKKNPATILHARIQTQPAGVAAARGEGRKDEAVGLHAVTTRAGAGRRRKGKFDKQATAACWRFGRG